MLIELQEIRKQVAESIEKACKIQKGQGISKDENVEYVDKKLYDAAVAENKKLKYRVHHL